MAEWAEVALGEVVSSLGGLWGKAEPDEGYVEVLALRGTDFAQARVLDLTGVPRRFEKQKAVAKRLLDSTSVVIEASGGSKDQPVGRSLLITRQLLDHAEVPLSAASFCKILWVDKRVADTCFIHGVLEYLYMSGGIDRFQTQSTGLRNLHTKQLLADFRFRLPPLVVQRRIAAILSAFDELIEINERRIELLENLARSLYREWFVYFRFPGHEDAEFVDSELGPIPKDWVNTVAAEIFHVNPKISSSQEVYRKVVMGDVSTRFSYVLPSQLTKRASGSRFKRADVLFARITPCLENGKTALVLFLDKDEMGVGSTEFIVLRGINVGPAFVYCAARSPELRDHAIKSMSGASGRQRVATDAFETIRIVKPTKDVSVLFEDEVMPMLESVFQYRMQNEQLAVTRDLLLPRLVTGQLDISNIDLGVLTSTETE